MVGALHMCGRGRGPNPRPVELRAVRGASTISLPQPPDDTPIGPGRGSRQAPVLHGAAPATPPGERAETADRAPKTLRFSPIARSVDAWSLNRRGRLPERC